MMMSSPRRLSLTDNDVLLGRGSVAKNNAGNQKFLSIVQQYKVLYAASTTNRGKNSIALTVLNEIEMHGGRFLEPVMDTHSDELWRQVDKDKAINRIKRALVDPHHKHQPGVQNPFAGLAPPPVVPTGGPVGVGPWNNALPASLFPTSPLQLQLATLQLGQNSLLLPLGAGLAQTGATIPQPFHGGLGGTLSGMLQQTTKNQPVATKSEDKPAHIPLPGNDSLPATHETKNKSPQAVPATHETKKLPATHRTKKSPATHETRNKSPQAVTSSDSDKGAGQQSKRSYSGDNSRASTAASAQPDINSEDVEAAQFLLGSMAETVKQAVAEIERQDERITEEQREEAVADMFGALCEINQSKKRVKWTATTLGSVEAVVQEMKAELEAIPSFEKLALSEAQGLALPVEFSGRRLELFLRREDMNPKRAAQRFVTYWEERRKLFGPEKFHLPMTLKGAMRDDLETLKNGPMFQAPALDASGRIVGGYVLKRDSGLDESSLLRAFWFYTELSSKHPNAARGVVRIIDCTDASMWDLNLEFIKTISRLKRTALPVRMRATHLCGLPRALSVWLMPLAFTKLDETVRIRVVLHDCPSAQTVEAFRDYGIPSRVVPIELGGTYDVDVERKKWLAQLRKLDETQIFKSDEFVWWEL